MDNNMIKPILPNDICISELISDEICRTIDWKYKIRSADSKFDYLGHSIKKIIIFHSIALDVTQDKIDELVESIKYIIEHNFYEFKTYNRTQAIYVLKSAKWRLIC
jgi:hypothetical protein